MATKKAVKKPRRESAAKTENAAAGKPTAVKRTKATATPAPKKSESGKKRSRKTSGFAETKEYPHKKHPAKFKKKRGSDTVIYITFTHSEEVTMNDKTVKTIPLNSNINPKERGTVKSDGKPNISHAYPKVYVGTRSALGKGTDKYSLTEADKALVDELFKLLPQEQVPKTSNSKKKPRK